MFKKQPKTWKTSSPLRTSDRKKLKQKIISTFGLADSKSSETTVPEGEVEAEAPDILPEGTLTLKFSTHLNEPGVVYLSPNGDPLWFSIGKDKGSGFDLDLIPTIYTLWNHPTLLPFLCTPQAVIPILTGGADLMRGGVIHCSPSLDVKEGQLVSICGLSYERVENIDTPMLSPPLAVGRMAISSKQLFEDRDGNGDSGQKGKAVLILHTWKDHLWEHGSGAKRDVPMGVPLRSGTETEAGAGTAVTEGGGGEQKEEMSDVQVGDGDIEDEGDSTEPTRMIYTAEQVSQLLRISLIHAIATSTTLNPNSNSSNSQSSSTPTSTTIFPIPATTFYTNYILPNRPYFPERVVSPDSASEASDIPTPDPYSITIKSSSHKSLTSFLKSLEKEKPASLISTKPPQKRSAQTDLLITAVNASHPDVQTYPSTSYVTVSQIEAKAAKKLTEESNSKDSKDPKGGELEVRELWKPHLSSVALFVEGIGEKASSLYTLPEIRSMLNTYIASKQLINPHDQAYINISDDNLLAECISKKPPKTKNKDKGKNQNSEIDAQVEFLKRDELVKRVLDNMQSWYEVKRAGEEGEVVTKKGTLSPIQIVTKIRQGRKSCTLISGFEPFSVGGNLGAEEMAEDLKRICAGATSVSPIPGKPGTQEVLVQGKQSKAVVEYLSGKGVPGKWIKVSEKK